MPRIRTNPCRKQCKKCSFRRVNEAHSQDVADGQKAHWQLNADASGNQYIQAAFAAAHAESIDLLLGILLNPSLWTLAQILAGHLTKMRDDVAHGESAFALHHFVES